MKRLLSVLASITVFAFAAIALPLFQTTSVTEGSFDLFLTSLFRDSKTRLNSPGAATDLFFSEYIEGSSNNKAIEIYNGTGAPVDLLTGNYVLQVHFNGSLTAGASFNLDPTISDGDVYVIANSSATNLTILAQADTLTSSSVVTFNGDDAVVLRKGGASGPIVDVIGQVGFDPGTEWGTGATSTADNTLVRKSSICAGDATGSNVFVPATEWDGFAQDTTSNLGTHTANCGDTTPPVAPIISGSSPSSPSSNQNPVVFGSAEAGSTVSLYTTADCTGSPAATGTAAFFESNGFNVPVAGNTTTLITATATDTASNVSPCSGTFAYVHDSIAPNIPVITGSVPVSPGNDTTPDIQGTADAGTLIRLYFTADCSGVPVGSGSQSAFSAGGITVFLPVPENSTTNIRATAGDDALNISGCSAPFAYTHAGGAPEIGVDTNTLAFGNQKVGVESPASTVLISNTGTTNLNIGTVTKTGTNAADFAITMNPSGGVITPGNSAGMQVTFTPSALGPHAAQITIPSNDADEPETIISLSGNGVEPGQLQFSSAFYSIDEFGGSATITVDRVGGDDGAISVQYQTGFSSTIKGKKGDENAPKGVVTTAIGGSACGFGTNVDYINANGTLNFADGETSKTFAVTVCDDDLFEVTEAVPLELSNPSGGALGTPNTAFLNIIDNDIQPLVQFSAGNFDVNENGGNATVTATRTGATEHEITVNFAANVGGTATEGTCGAFTGADFTGTSGTLTFAPADNSETFNITICNDGLFEASNETILIALNTQSAPALLGTPNDGTVTIISNNDPPSVEFSGAASSVGEGDGTKTFTVNRTGAIENAFTVNFATDNGTAVAGLCGSGGDYVSNSGTLSFVAGDPLKTFAVTICEDAQVDPNETFSATLSGPTDGAVIGTTNTETVTITDNDAPVTLVVDTTADNIALNACTPAPNDCSLRGANSIVNDGDTITFSSLFDTAQTITLGGTQIDIVDSVTIAGPGAKLLTISGNGASRIFTTAVGKTVSMGGLTLSGGFSTSSGGAIQNEAALTITACAISGNTALSFGGGIRNMSGSLTLINSTISGNSAVSAISPTAGGIDSSVLLSITNSTISGNAGGGVYADGNTTIVNSTITNNSLLPAPGLGAATGVRFNGAAGSITVTNSIIAANQNNDVIPDISGTFTSGGFNIIGNATNAIGLVDGVNGDQVGPVTPPLHSPEGSVVPLDPVLGPLADNGGPTLTHGLLAGGPGIDKGSSFGATLDQRGLPRIVDFPSIPNATGGDGADIGAFEIQAPTAAQVTLGGRVSTASGQGIRNAVIMLSGGDLSAPRTVYTGTFGYYKIDGLQAGVTYVVLVNAKRYVFSTPSLVVSLTDNVSDINFVASP